MYDFGILVVKNCMFSVEELWEYFLASSPSSESTFKLFSLLKQNAYPSHCKLIVFLGVVSIPPEMFLEMQIYVCPCYFLLLVI
jgi:hypothetical protein